MPSFSTFRNYLGYFINYWPNIGGYGKVSNVKNPSLIPPSLENSILFGSWSSVRLGSSCYRVKGDFLNKLSSSINGFYIPLGDPSISGNEAYASNSYFLLKDCFDGVSKEGSLSSVEGWEGLVKYNLRSSKVGVSGFDGGAEGVSGLNHGKGSKVSRRGRKYFISLAQNKALNKVLAGKKLTMEGVL